MNGLYIALIVLGGLLLLLLITLSVCFKMTFYMKKRRAPGPEEFRYPPGEAYRPYYGKMREWTRRMREHPYEEVAILSRDGLILRGRYYEHRTGAPLEILVHGYRGDPERDMNAGLERAFALGHNALFVSQRACGESEGHVITFGIREHLDCLDWISFASEKFGKDTPIFLTGISMGAATVLMAAGEPLPENVVGVLADCPYTSARDIIRKVVADRGLPPRIFYPLIRLSARLFGRFDLEENSPIEAVARARLPIILIHGETDGFVPCEMSRRLYAAAAAEKRLVTVPDADHGLAYPKDPESYLDALRAFREECHLPTSV